MKKFFGIKRVSWVRIFVVEFHDVESKYKMIIMKSTTFMRTLLIIFCLVGCVFGATYKGKNIDGKKYEAIVMSGGVISDARVIFDGKYVDIYLGKRIVTAKMAGEVIDDPQDIVATDGKDTWTIDVTNIND